MPTSTESMVSTAFKIPEIFSSEKSDAIDDVSISAARHNKSSASVGRKIAANATTPYIPIDDRKSITEADIVDTASESAAPATGTDVPKINFAVRIARLSAAAFTVVCMPKIPTKRVEQRDKTHIDILFIKSVIPELRSSGDTPVLILSARYPPIKGSTANELI